MSDTPLLGLPLLDGAQAQKHVTHNEALLKIDGIIHLSVESRVLSAPPASPSDGARYLVAASATGSWLGKDGAVALREAGAWRYVQPTEGWRMWVRDEDRFLVFTGAIWRDLQAIDTLQNMTLLGVNASADSANRLSVSSPAVLLNHAGSGMQLKLNKQAAANTGSLLYQTNFSGRAEMGLAGDDDFRVKVSADGSSWFDALRIDRTTGAVSMPNTAMPGLADGNKSDVVVSGSGAAWRVERTGGAAGDGVTDDTAALQSVLTAGKSVLLGHGKTYLISAALNITAAGTGIIGDGSATLLMSEAAGAFDNADASVGARYGANAVGISASGVRRPVVRGLRIRYRAWTDLRYVKAIALRNCSDIECSGNSISNFSRAKGLVTLNDVTGGTVSGNHIFDCRTLATSGTATDAQITGIELDNDAATASSGIAITGNRIRNLTLGDAARAALGYQTDGINIAKYYSTNHVVSGNIIENVGEGVDCFGSNCVITGNRINRCFNYGVKHVHGASGNECHSNTITNVGLAGIDFQTSSSAVQDIAGNSCVGNTITGVGIAGDWLMGDVWVTATPVSAGDYRVNAGKLYQASASGLCGATAPTHSSGSVSDGGVTWTYVSAGLAYDTLAYMTAWASGAAVSSGTFRANAGKLYVAQTGGTTGATAPTHTSGTASDGAVTWAFLAVANWAAWAGNSTRGIGFSGSSGNPWHPRNNRISGNTIDLGGTGAYGVMSVTGVGSGNIGERNAVSNWLAPNGRQALIQSAASWAAYASAVNDSNAVAEFTADAAITLAMESGPNILISATLSANRAVNLPSASVHEGAAFTIVRTGGGAFVSNVGSGPLAALAQNQWCKVIYQNGAWRLWQFGTFSAGGGGGLSDGDKGDIVVSGSGAAWTIDANSVDNGKAAQMAAGTLKGNNSGATANAIDLTVSQVTAMLNAASTTLQGMMSAADKTKLNGIASGATANSADATLFARANHTGTQTRATISDLNIHARRIAGAMALS